MAVPIHERLPVHRLKVIRLRGVRTTQVDLLAGFGPVDADIEAGTLVAVTPTARGRSLLDVLDGCAAGGGDIEIAGTSLDGLTDREREALRERSLARVTLDADGGAPLPAGAGAWAGRSVRTVRQALTSGPLRASGPPIGPSLPLQSILDHRLTELDAPTHGLVAIAYALNRHADVLMIDAIDLPDDSPVPAGLARPLRDLVDLEGRTVLFTIGHPALLRVAEQVITLNPAT